MEFTNKQKRIIILGIVGILLLLILFLIVSILIVNRNKHINRGIDISTGYSSIREIIEHYNSKYIKEYYDESEEYPTEVEVEFKYKLYENNESNEKYFNNIINDIAKFINYTNFKIEDEKNDITIEVICEDRKIKSIVINGIEDYFIHMNSQMELAQYKEISRVNLNSSSDILNVLISNSWDSNINFGSRDAIFKNYFIFFDEGIEYRKIGSTMYNIVFTKNYNGYVIENLTPESSVNSVKAILGQPSFEDEKLGVVGYKGNEFYAFFNGEEISIYKCINYNYEDFWDLVNKFIDEDSEMTFKEFMNELTYIWKDYSEYDYSEDHMFISYPNRGVDVKLNYNDISGIIIYNNISENLTRVKRYLDHSEFISNLKLDNVFEAEKRRLNEKIKWQEECKEYEKYMEENLSKEELENIGKTELCNYYMDLDNNGNTISVYFLPKDKNYSRRELNESVYKYMWINQSKFLYSVHGKGIYLFDILTGEKRVVAEGNDNFDIKSYEQNILTYDNMRMSVELY